MYRWYNFFNVDPSIQTGRPGVTFPYVWEDVKRGLLHEVEDLDLQSISSLSSEQLHYLIKLNNKMSEDVKEAFVKFMAKQKS